MFLRKYGTGTGADVIIPIIKRGVVDFAATGDWTPASGDVKVSKDGAAEANIGTLPAINGTYGWKFVFSDAELQCKSLTVRVVDSATKAIEDQFFIVETYGHASAMFQSDLAAAQLPANVTHFGGSAGTFASGRPEVNATHWAGTAVGSAVVPANVVQISGDATAADNLEAALDGTGGVTLSVVLGTDAITAASLAASAGAELAALVETYIVNEGDATAVMQAIADKIAADWVAGDASPLAIVAAIKADATIATMISRVDATISSRSSHSAADVLTALGTGTWATAIPWNAAWDAEVQSEVQDAIEVNHLDHLLAQTYDPASKPGAADALLNELIGNDAGVSQFTANALELAPSGGGGGGGTDWTADERTAIRNALGIPTSGTTLLDPTTGILDTIRDQVVANGTALAGTPIQPTSRVASGGTITAYIGDDFKVRSDTELSLSVSDVGGALYTKWNAIGEENLYFGASREGADVGAITGTVAAITSVGSGASQTCRLTIEITNCGSGLKPGTYDYQIEQRQTQGSDVDSFIEVAGSLILKRNSVA